MSYEKHATTLINCFTATVHAYSAMLLVEVTLTMVTIFAKNLPPVDTASFILNLFFGILALGLTAAMANKLFYNLFMHEARKDQEDKKLEYFKARLLQPLYSHTIGNDNGAYTKTIRYANHLEDDWKTQLAKLIVQTTMEEAEDAKKSDATTTAAEPTTAPTTATTAAATTPTDPVTPGSASAHSNTETEAYSDAKMAKMAKGPDADAEGEIKKAV